MHMDSSVHRPGYRHQDPEATHYRAVRRCLDPCGDEPRLAVAIAPRSRPSGGTLKAALTGEPDTLDPATSTIYTGAQVYDNIFSKLIDLDENNEFYGVLATDWNQVDDTTWVFDLVDNATFHNGEPFTPADVVYTFERILDPATASGYAPLFDAIDSVEATGHHQVTFHLKTPFGPFLEQPRQQRRDRQPEGHRIQQIRRASRSAPDPSSSSSGSRAIMSRSKKNENYFRDGLPYLDGVDLPLPARRSESHRGSALRRARLGRRGAAAAAAGTKARIPSSTT